MQGLLTDAGTRRVRVEALQATLDSVSAAMSTHQAVANENETLRELLALQERAGPTYRPATVHRPGTPGSESTFLVNVGSRDGIRAGAPVVSPTGLVGVIRETRTGNSVGIDWTHPDFRPSAMLADGSAYGLIESRRGAFREEDRLVLNGIPFHEPVDSGQAVLTSGLGGIFPRGIPIGTVLSVAEAGGYLAEGVLPGPDRRARCCHARAGARSRTPGTMPRRPGTQDTVGVAPPGSNER